MSAAEKLRALEAAKNGYFGIGHSSDWMLVDALPQIVAVVEAAERLAKYPNVNRPAMAREARDALAALDEALGAVT